MRWSVSAFCLSLFTLSVFGSVHESRSRGWTTERKLEARELTRSLWNHGFDSYMHHAFPLDELKPLTCTGQGPDWFDPTAIHFNDVLANCSVTLIDNLDSFLILNNRTGFNNAVWNTISHVSFDVDTKPQVFETTIRVLGGLLSAHIFSVEPNYGFAIPGYDNQLLSLAYDLGERLLQAFDTPTGIPYARVNLRRGVPAGETTETCSAGAGSLLLEFTTLSRLTGDPRFEDAAVRSFFAIWNRRSQLDLIGNTIDLISGRWLNPGNSGIGAGIDSFYEYALKMYVLTGENRYLDVWNDSYGPLMKHSRGADGFWYRTVSMETGELATTWIDSLGAFWPGLQVLAGDVESAIKSHMAYWNLWKRFSGMPETFNVMTREGISLGYPLRPEFIESTYFLYRATRDSFYLDVGARILEDFIRRTKVPCGLATVSNVLTGAHEDRMESFALSESLKYLYLLFDEDNMFNQDFRNFVFTTEGHVLFLDNMYFRQPPPIQPALHRSSHSICPAYSPPLVTSSRQGGSDLGDLGGLIGSVRERPDFEYARLLAGIVVSPDAYDKLSWSKTSGDKNPFAVIAEEDKAWWDENGWCEVPRVEEYVHEWILSSDGGLVPEDRFPGPDKIRKVVDGYEVLNITGIRTQVTARIDRTAYDITRLGQYRVYTGQKVYISDPIILRTLRRSEALPKSFRRFGLPDVILYFSFAPSLTSSPWPSNFQAPLRSANAGFNESFVFDALAATASFGGNPVLPPQPFPLSEPLESESASGETSQQTRTTMPDPLIFSADSPFNGAVRVVRAPVDNPYGCHDYPRDFIRWYSPPVRSGGQAQEKGSVTSSTLSSLPTPTPSSSCPSSSTFPSPSSSEPSAHLLPVVVFIRRGECAFLQKLILAKKAHFAGVIVWNDSRKREPSESEAGPGSSGGSDGRARGTGGSGGGKLDADDGELINPSIDKSDEELARRELWDVSIVAVGRDDGSVIDEMLGVAEERSVNANDGGGWDVIVEVKRVEDVIKQDENTTGKKKNKVNDVDDGDDDDGGKKKAHESGSANSTPPPPVQLYINGLALRNTIVLR
ncbi:glycoside hydrolase [Cantharellus anzutake]|uniref:glycoside hydrolase n=1 Tax=Cantharellus anzutake TaxID=1750568 RepID=UPI0019050DEB|nr:glycoside hydrolase [Cantharellus anzutake]KAF8332804.1 glycoside hydrolase [Cantharellus anzutake]